MATNPSPRREDSNVEPTPHDILPTSAQDFIDLRSIRTVLTEYIDQRALDIRVLDALRQQGGFVPQETELWDYKRDLPTTAVDVGKTVRLIVSLHNSFGGYALFGVDEVIHNDGRKAVGIRNGQFNVRAIRDKLKDYTGEYIDVSFADLDVTLDGATKTIGVLCVPKRVTSVPISFGRPGPDVETRKPLFNKDDVYLRKLDRCERAVTKEDYVFLLGSRANPHLWSVAEPLGVAGPFRNVVANTLPNRILICPKFVGRDIILTDLWRWFTDDFEFVKFLVGDGGKGKTSIAYEFAQQVCLAPPQQLEKIIWLSAKQRRFVGIQNEYLSMPSPDFSDANSLLQALASELAITSDEIGSDASLRLVQRNVAKALKEFRVLVVVDDIDSAEVAEQKEILNICLRLASQTARFLCTTRMNFAFSPSMIIKVGGLHGDDYQSLVSNWVADLAIKPFTVKQIKAIHSTSDGSPLYTESILRLVKLGMPLDAALNKWRGKLGQEVRNAALRREVGILSPEAKVVLYACAYMGSASRAELKQATAYIDAKLDKCLEELEALFLMAAPQIIRSEPRFAVAENTRRLVLENRDIVINADALEARIRRRRDTAKVRTAIADIGAAINQATAMLADERYDDAISTVEAALLAHPDHPDLLSTQALCLLRKGKERNDESALNAARSTYKRCHDLRHERPGDYHCWYEAELLARHWSGAVDVATLAIEAGLPGAEEWFRRRSAGYMERARVQVAGSNVDLAIDDFNAAADDLMMTRRSSFGWPAASELLRSLHDEIWRLVETQERSFTKAFAMVECCRRAIDRGDKRRAMAGRLLDAVQVASTELRGAGLLKETTESQRGAVRQLYREADRELRRLRTVLDERVWDGVSAQFRAFRAPVDVQGVS